MSFSRSLSRAASKSSLWRSWSPNPAGDYERSLYKFPWLSQGVEDGYEHEALKSAPPLTSMEEEQYPWETVPRRPIYGETSTGDPESQSLEPRTDGSVELSHEPFIRGSSQLYTDPEDPNLVSNCWTYISCIRADPTILGHMVRARRSYEPSQLAAIQEVVFHHPCLVLHIYFPRLVDHVGTSAA